jgi:ribonuclease HIII
LQGTSSPVFDRVKEIIQSVKPLSELENALLFVPEEEKAAVEAKLAENPQAFPHLQSKAEERVSKEAFEFLYSHDKEMLMSAIHILEALRSSNLHMPLYNPIIFPFARVFEGFIIRLMVEKRFFTLQQFRENPDIARIGNALRQRKFEKYIKDPVRNSRVLDKLTTIWEDLRCHELHSDPVQNPGIVGLRDITQVENRIGEISSAIMDGYRVLVKHGYTEEEMLANRGGRSPSDVSAKPSDPSEQGRTIDAMPLYESRIGTDESGKGDYFGPLVIAGVFLASEMEDKLERIGIRDSKKNSDARNRQLASEIKKLLGKDSYNVVCISPEKYNELYTKMKNLNTLLAWGHARVIENILSKVSCAIAIADQFGSEDYIKKALMERGKTINLLQTPKAERDMAVAAASILARDMFLQQIDQLEVGCGMSLPKGASPAVEEAARLLIEKSGNQSLGRYAKLHFKTTEKVRK